MGLGSLYKQTVVGVVKVVVIQIQFQGGGVSLKADGIWGSEGSCHSDLASRVGLGCL